MAARGRGGEGTSKMWMSLSSLSDPPVGKVQKLEGKECTVAREINCSGEATQEVAHFRLTSAMLREGVALESTVRRSPTRVQTSRRWPARIHHGLRRERQAQGHPEKP